uniref:Uncharacterized protein n=1 Tax=Acrobeloides nanus TaxID=290746 RepID=A0A914BWV9_9BILA
MFECLDCPATPFVKFQRQAVDDANARCNMACMNRGCNAGFINNFETGYLNCTCTICQATSMAVNLYA